MTINDLYEALVEDWGARRSRKDLTPIAKVDGPHGKDLQKDSKGRYYIDGVPVPRSEGLKLQWSAEWVYHRGKLVKVGK